MSDKQIVLSLSNLSLDDVNLILSGLQEMPYRLSNSLIGRITSEAQAQVNTAQAPTA